jgi:hypothetical protein
MQYHDRPAQRICDAAAFSGKAGLPFEASIMRPHRILVAYATIFSQAMPMWLWLSSN